MRIAFFGGTFDPPHRGHLAIARAAAFHLHLDTILFAPVGRQPLKLDTPEASFDDRLAMVRLAIAGDPAFEASDIDAPRQEEPNYTIDTLSRLKSMLRPEDQLFCLIGADSFNSLPHWHKAAELLFVAEFIVAGRPGFELDSNLPNLPSGIAASITQAEKDLLVLSIQNDQAEHAALYLLPNLEEDVSATEIRSALAESAIEEDSVLPLPVTTYIHKRGLYGVGGQR